MAQGTIEAIRRMQERMRRLSAESIEETTTLSLRTILMPYLRWAGVWLVVASGVAALAYRLARWVRWWRLALNGVAAAAIGLGVGWSIDPGSGLLAWAAPIVMCGCPAAVGQWSRGRPWRESARTFVAWVLAAAIPASIVRPC